MGRFLARAFVRVVAVASTGAALAQAPTPPVPPTDRGSPIVVVPPIVVEPPPSDGLLKVCKVGGPGIPVGTPFTVTAGNGTFTVPSGPPPGGTCVIGPRFPVGTHVTVAETIPPGILVSSIAVAPSGRLDGSPNLAGGSANITIGSGVTEVTFTNKRTGFLEICKTGEVRGNFSFSVNPGGLGPFVVPAGACSAAIEVPAGEVTIHELPSAGTAMSGCTTIPPAQQGACNLGAQISTVTVAPGDISTMTIAFIANKRATDQTGTDVSLEKTVTKGPEPGRVIYTLAVKNEGAPINAATTTITINDPLTAGVTVTGFGGTSASNWSCTPPFAVPGPNTLACKYIGGGTIATGAVLPPLVLNATLATIGSEPVIVANCATVALATAAGPVAETNTVNNRSCAVTASVNPEPCVPGKCPQPVAECKQDVLMVVDASLSIAGGLPTVKNAIARFLQPMQNRGGRVNIFSFNNQPNWTPITTGGWTSVTSSNWSALANPIVLSGTRTNWDDALERAYNVVLADSPNKPVVIEITDGAPNASNNPSGAEVDNTNSPMTAATEAVEWINKIRAAGSPIIAIGFGQAASTGYIDAAFTGNSSDPTNINFETSSVIKMDSVNSLPGVMATLGNQMCGTLSLEKKGPPTFVHPVTPPGAPNVSVNDVVPFTLELTNNAMTPVNGIVVQDQVPTPALTSVTVAPPTIGSSPATPPGNLITWSIPTLAARTTAKLNFTGKFVKTYPAPAVNVPTVETIPNFAQVMAAQNYDATALGTMNPVNGPATLVTESVATFTEYVYAQPPDLCLATTGKPAYCYVSVGKVRKNPGAEDGSCTSSAAGGPTNPCPFTVTVNLSSYVPAGSTVTIEDSFTVGGTPISPAWAATVASNFCPASTPTTVPFTCPHGSVNSFSGDVTVMIPPGQTGQKVNCVKVRIDNPTSVPPLNNVFQTGCTTF